MELLATRRIKTGGCQKWELMLRPRPLVFLLPEGDSMLKEENPFSPRDRKYQNTL